jgi:hypothetical protein
MKTREWVAVHRKHHARVATEDDPHSPQVRGIHRVLWGGVFLYRREAACAGRPLLGLPQLGDRRREHQHRALGRPHRRRRAAQQPPRLPDLATLSNRWYELDIGLDVPARPRGAGLAKVKRVAPSPRFVAPRPTVDLHTLHAVIVHRCDVLARYARAKRRELSSLGALDGLARPAPEETPGLVPPRRDERHPTPRGVLAAPAQLRLKFFRRAWRRRVTVGAVGSQVSERSSLLRPTNAVSWWQSIPSLEHRARCEARTALRNRSNLGMK